MQPASNTNLFVSLIPFLLITLAIGVIGYFLAKDKGRSAFRWAILCVIPGFGYCFLAYLVGCTNLRLEAKLDAILAASDQRAG